MHIEEGYRRASKWRLTAKCLGYTIGDKAMRPGMPLCELKWEMSVEIAGGESDR